MGNPITESNLSLRAPAQKTLPLCVALRSSAMLGGAAPDWAFWAVTGGV